MIARREFMLAAGATAVTAAVVAMANALAIEFTAHNPVDIATSRCTWTVA